MKSEMQIGLDWIGIGSVKKYQGRRIRRGTVQNENERRKKRQLARQRQALGLDDDDGDG